MASRVRSIYSGLSGRYAPEDFFKDYHSGSYNGSSAVFRKQFRGKEITREEADALFSGQEVTLHDVGLDPAYRYDVTVKLSGTDSGMLGMFMGKCLLSVIPVEGFQAKPSDSVVATARIKREEMYQKREEMFFPKKHLPQEDPVAKALDKAFGTVSKYEDVPDDAMELLEGIDRDEEAENEEFYSDGGIYGDDDDGDDSWITE